MNNNSKISPLSICFLSSFLYRSFYIIGLFNLIISISKGDSIFSIIIGILLGLIVLYSYFYLNDKLTKDNIFIKISKSLPKIISDFIIATLIILFIFICGFTLYNLSLFVNYNLLNNINILPISTLLIITVIYLASKGINTITRVSGILIFTFISLVIISMITLINYSDPNNIYPLLTNSFLSIYEGSIYHMVLSVTPIFLLLIIPKDRIEDNKKYNRYMLITYIISFVYILINYFLILSILGIKLTSILNYPDIIVLQKVSLLNFVERIEDLLSFKLMFDGFLFLALASFYIKEGILHLFRMKPNKKLILVVGLMILIVSIYFTITNIKLVLYLMTAILLIHFILMILIRKKS